jgi:hypothetical protein
MILEIAMGLAAPDGFNAVFGIVCLGIQGGFFYGRSQIRSSGVAR